MTGHRGFHIEPCQHGWPATNSRPCPLCEPEDTPSMFFPYNLSANIGAKLPPQIKPFREPPTVANVRQDFVDFLKLHTLMTPEAATHCLLLIERIIWSHRNDHEH